ncbi:CPBP family intramembrane glutamic endopeptidase [Flavobacterium solisilvae]|uniref:CPBP family intramembrane metalloprotease n=1 Tax=Flavobacterium solisilvae TaxID=1852019 RepID=A0ABX1QYG5_9FLAO|nr:type II CAAX endopeptidase family protein [Flavobacterium solisilvae]NMH26373.1 CPBP family intramembrane metalloprotease [Flavobacterium solisilvae]
MFLENAVTPENKFWKYIVGSVVIIAASFIGKIPFMIAIAFKSFSSGKPFPTDEKSLLSFLNPNLSLFLLMLSFVFAFLAIYLVIKYLHKQTFLSVTTSRSKMDWKRFFFSFSIWGIFTIASTVIMYYSNPEDFEINFKPIPFTILAVIAIILIPIQTSTEEYIFRGYLMQGFANLAKNKWFPLVMTSVIFGTMHIANPEVQKLGYIIMIYYIGTGLFLGILTLMDEGMELALGFHAANNLIAALLITSDWSAFQTESILKDNSEPSAGFEILVPVFIIFPILLFIFSKKYGWTNWKEKLTGKIEEKNVEPF